MPDRTPAEELAAAADKLDAIPDDELERCLGVDGQPCGADPVISREAVRALAALLRAACDGNDIDGYEPGQVEHYFGEELALARAILGSTDA